MADSVIDLAPLDGATETADTTQGDTFEQSSTEQTQQTDQTSQQQQTGADGQQVDGRKGPQNIRNSIKAASEAIPEQAEAFKQLGNAYFREQAYKQHFPTPQEAASAKQLIEGIGGVEGAATLTQRIQGYDAQDEALRSGSPEVLDAFFKDFADGAVALAPHYLDKLQQTNPQAFTAAIAPHAIALLESSGVGGHLQAILNETDPARAKALVQLAPPRWYKARTQNVAQIKANGTARKDPRRGETGQRSRSLRNREGRTLQVGRVGARECCCDPGAVGGSRQVCQAVQTERHPEGALSGILAGVRHQGNERRRHV